MVPSLQSTIQAVAAPLAYVVSQQPHDGVRLDHSGSIVVKSRRSIETEDFAYSLDRGPGNGARRDALQK
jgi:hypothetical protein